jgi:quinol monooxygenase YgiN
MVKIGVFVRHKVKDYAKWRKVFLAHAKLRRAGGEKEYWISHIAGQPKNLCLFFEWTSAAKAKKFLASKELKEKMKAAGVIEKPQIYIFDEVDKGRT